MPPPPLHSLLKINEFLSPPQDCSTQNHTWDAVIPRCDVATLQLCNSSDGEVKFCEFSETTPIAVEDVLFMTVERYPRVSFTVAVARGKDGKTRIIDRSHDFFAYRYYSFFPPKIMKDAYKDLREVYEKLLVATSAVEINTTVFLAFDYTPRPTSHGLEELFSAACGYSQVNLSGVPWLAPEMPTSANNAFMPLFQERLGFNPVFVKLDTVYRIKRMYFPMFYVSVRHESTGCREKFVDATLAALPTNPPPIPNLCWMKFDNDGAVKYSTAGIFNSTRSFQKLLRDNNFTVASGSMDIKTKMYHVNHAKMIIASYGGTFSMARILRSRPVHMQRLLLLVHDDYRAQLSKIIATHGGKLNHAGVNHGEFLFFDHVWDKFAFRIPAKPFSNLLVKVVCTSNLNNIRQEDLDDWNFTGRDYNLYYAERLVIVSATYGSATANTTHCNNVSIASLVEKSMRKGVIYMPAAQSTFYGCDPSPFQNKTTRLHVLYRDHVDLVVEANDGTAWEWTPPP